MSLWRFNFSDINVEKGKKFVKGTIKKEPSFLKGRKGEIKNGKLYIDGKLVVSKSKQETFIRNKVLTGTVPMTRDGLYYHLSKISIGCTRAAIDKILKSANIIRETDNVQPSTKRAARRVHKKGQIEFDLVEINWQDLGFKPTDEDIERESGYIFTIADALTGYLWAKFSPTKSQNDITPTAREGFNSISKALNTPLKSMHALSDHGDEFNFKLYTTWGLRNKQVGRAPLIEMKNSQFQRALYRVAKMKNTKSIHKLVKSAMTIVNRTQSSLTGVSPVDALTMSVVTLADKYNKRRGPQSGGKIRARPLVVGDMVRIMLLKEKDKGSTFYKAYKGKSWSKRRYEVLKKRRNKYKITTSSGTRFYHRDNLRLTSEADKETIKILNDRETAAIQKDVIDTAKRRKKIDSGQGRRSSRRGTQKAKEKYRAMADREKRRDREIGS